MIDRLLRRCMYERFNYVLDAREGEERLSLLDVGCGSGRHAVAIAKMGAKRIVGVDYAQGMVDLANEAAVASGVSEHCDFVCTDFLDFEPRESFDYSIAMGFFDYVKEPVPYLRKMAALTNKRLMVSFPIFSWLRSPQRKVRYALLHRCPVYFYTVQGVHSILKDAGLTDGRVVQMRGGPGADVIADVVL